MTMLTIALAVGSFLLGAVPFGVLVARTKGVDLRSVGSGNIGTTNATRALGWKLGLLVFALDILKGLAPPIVARQVPECADFAVLFGAVAVIGHTASPFLHFKGGKGVATGLGALFGTAPLVGVVGFGAFIVLFALTRIVSFSSLLASLIILTSAYFFRSDWLFFAVFGPLIAFVFIRHIDNIKRLFKGQEPKLSFQKPSPNVDQP